MHTQLHVNVLDQTVLDCCDGTVASSLTVDAVTRSSDVRRDVVI